ncbi:MAG: chlorophyll synthase ChlG [Pseudomonadota bacterium]
MSNSGVLLPRSTVPSWRALLELSKPVTWFAPMWAYMCGVVSSGVPLMGRWQFLMGGIILAGPFVCAASQAVNDWYDRHVDAINEPERPIPSGRIPGRWGLYVAIIWSALSLILGAALGLWAFFATVFGVILAWAYSAPPLRLKLNGWWGNAAVGFSYEGIAWFTGAAVMLGSLPNPWIIGAAVLYSIGAHGIMTLNDFKAIEGDIKMGVRSLPVQLGPGHAAQLACIVMAIPQAIVILALIGLGLWGYALAVWALLAAQLYLMADLLRSPREKAPWYNATGTTLYVLGMLVTAFAIGTLSSGVPL